MNIHKNAKFTPRGREEMVKLVVEHGLSYRQAAAISGVDPKTVRRWRADIASQFEAHGIGGLQTGRHDDLQPARRP